MQASYLNACSRLHDVLWDPISDAYLFKKACELLWPAFLKKKEKENTKQWCTSYLYFLYLIYVFYTCLKLCQSGHYYFTFLSSAEWILIKNLFFCVSASCAHACLCRCWYLILAVRCMCGMVKKSLWHRERWPSSWPSTCGTAPLTTRTVTSTHSTQEDAIHSYPGLQQ